MRGPSISRLAAPLAAAGVALALVAPGQAAALGPVPWCGSPVDRDLAPDALPALSWHVVYAFPSDRPDRFAEWAPRIAGDMAEIDAWWRGQDPTRRPRLDLHVFPGCTSEFGQLDLTRVALPDPSSVYDDVNLALTEIADALAVRTPALASPDKAYLVYFDGRTSESNVCGIGGARLGDQGPLAFATVLLAACRVETDDGFRATVAAHEMVHGMGALPRGVGGVGPPNACPGDPGHPCDDARDLLSPRGGGPLAELVLDVGRDDYYGHGRAWFDLRASTLLERLDATDRAAPTPPSAPTATTVGGLSVFTWGVSQDESPVTYRLYTDAGELYDIVEGARFTVREPSGTVLTVVVRAVDQLGFLSAPVTIRYRVGYGLVDAAGRLVRDTVAPGPVTGLRASVQGRKVVVRWRAAVDLGGLRGYRVTVGGRTVALVRTPSAAFALTRAAGRVITVAAVDRGGNAGPSARTRAPRR